MTREELRHICVDAFPDSLVRRRILESLFFVLDRLTDDGITGEAWIDGSFLTEKPDPADVDVVFRIPGEQYDRGTAQQHEASDWVSKNLKDALLCDTFVFFVRAEDHPYTLSTRFDRIIGFGSLGRIEPNNQRGLP